MVIASSISGLPIYAPSAGFAPTNSADVSAIASAYQVVSSTATQLYAGTAYVTSVNDAPISASRAGNAANASMANSAYYDGTGRLISALPDSATVSAIASSYAESAASGKQDELTFSYDDDKISAINGSALAGQGGTTYVSPSGTVWISGSSIEGTDSAYFPDREETNLAYSAAGFTAINTGSNAYTATGANIVYATGNWLNGTISALANNVLVAESAYVGEVTMFSASADSGPLVLQSDNWWDMQSISAYTAGVTPASVVPLAHASSVSSKLDVSASSQFQPRGNYQSAGNYLSASTVGFTDTSYTAVTSMSGVQLYGTDSAFTGVAVASGNGLLDTAIETAIVGTGHSQVAVHINGMTGQYFDVSAVDSAGSLLSRNTYDLDASGKTFVFPSASAISSLYINGNRYYRLYDYTASAFDIIPLAHASALPTYQYDAEDKISSINGSAIAGGGAAGVDSATCSAIASAYAESAVSSVSGNYYTTANESGYALSADVSGTVDLVSTQSANWGGSALALSAGPGVKLEKVGNTLVASTDETVLFSGSNGGMVETTLTEPLSGFNSFKICFNPFGNGMSREWKEFSWASSSDVYTVATFHKNGNDNLAWYAAFQPNTDGTTLTPIANKLWILGSTTVQDRTQMAVYRVVGINRTAEA
jgi:hypothetical protein